MLGKYSIWYSSQTLIATKEFLSLSNYASTFPIEATLWCSLKQKTK
jgi:hypothetical protein